MTTDESVARQAAQYCRAQQALRLLQALADKSAYIEIDGWWAIEPRPVTDTTVGGSEYTEVAWVATNYKTPAPHQGQGFETLAEPPTTFESLSSRVKSRSRVEPPNHERVPVMLSVVRIVNASKPWYEAR